MVSVQIGYIRSLILKIPAAKDFKSDKELERDFFDLSEDVRLPEKVRDFCLDLSLRAGGIETAPLGIADAPALLSELQKQTSDLR